MESKTVVGIDVGTTKVCTLVAEVDPNRHSRIVGVGIAPSRGIRKGIVVNISEVAAAIGESLQLAERSSGYEIASAYVGLAGAHVEALNSRGITHLNNGHRVIHPSDINRALESARSISLADDREILHVIPRNFTVDGDDGVRDPIGMHAGKLEVEAHIVTGATSSINNLVTCIQSNQVNIDGLVLEPLASGEAVLTDMERDMGVVLADIGGGTTDIAIFIEGAIWHTSVLPTGGLQLTNDLAVGLRTPFDTAEAIKRRYGHCLPNKVNPDETVEVGTFGEADVQQVPRQFVAEIIQARMEEIFELIQREVKRSGYDGLLPAGIVLTGGTAGLRGIKEIGREVMHLPTRVGAPQNLHGLIDQLDEPAYATSVGLLEWGKHHQPEPITQKGRPIQFKVPSWLKALLPG